MRAVESDRIFDRKLQKEREEQDKVGAYPHRAIERRIYQLLLKQSLCTINRYTWYIIPARIRYMSMGPF